MAVKQLNTAPDPLAFIRGASDHKPEEVAAPKPVEVAKTEPVAAPKPEKVAKPKKPKKPEPTRFFVYVDEELLARIDKERKRRGGVGRSTLLKLLAAEHLPE